MRAQLSERTKSALIHPVIKTELSPVPVPNPIKLTPQTRHGTPQAAGHSGGERQSPRIVQAYKVPFKPSFEGLDAFQNSTLIEHKQIYFY